MRDLRRSVVAALAAALAACSGGGHDDSIPAGTCRRAAVPTTGPGDTLSYFPAEVGRTWTYRDESTGETPLVTVSGTQVAGAETASVFTMTGAGAAPITELVVKRPAGVYVLSESPPADPPFDQLYPSLVLPFPVVPMPETEQATCRALDVGDLDGDGKADHADITLTLRVFSVTETATIGAGSFMDVAHVQTLARIKATATGAGALDVVATQDDWFAKAVGRVNSLVTITMPAYGVTQSVTTSLQSWTLPGAALVAAPLSAPPAHASAARPARLEEAALRLAQETLVARP